MNAHNPIKLTAMLMFFLFQSLQCFSQDSTFTPPKGFIDSMTSREAANGHIIYLKKYFSQCMIGDSLDINCPKIKQVYTLNLPLENRMVDLSWIKYFDNLTELTVNYNFINILPDTFPSTLKKLNLFYNEIETSEIKPFSVLPNGLTHLDVSYQRSRKFKTLPELPDSLLVLVASYNIIESLPNTFPVKLKQLHMQSNRLVALPAGLDAVPLEILNASYNSIAQLTSISDKLVRLNLTNNILSTFGFTSFPSTLKSINLQDNKLTRLPALGPNLEHLDVSFNELVHLPALPSNLKVLQADKNKLIDLPNLPVLLQQLSVSQNSIVAIPTFPPSLTDINIGMNQLTALPALPSMLINLNVENNSLSSLPALPTNLLSLCIGNNLFSGTLSNLPVSLIVLKCDTNTFTSITLPIPSILEVLTFSNNDVTVFPLNTLPGTLDKLYCANNGLLSIPQLPETLVEIKAKGNVFTCLPNLPINLGSTDIRIVCNKNCWLPASGNWNSAANWSTGLVPTNTTDVVILDAEVLVNQSVNVKHIDIRASYVHGPGVLNVKGNINNNNAFFEAEVNMNGSSNQTISRVSNAKLTINNTSGVKLESVSYLKVLSVPQGYIEKGTYSGNVKIERLGYCHSGTIIQGAFIEVKGFVNSGWIFTTNNVVNQQFDALSNYISLGFGATNQTVYKYNGQLASNNGWLPVASLTEAFSPGGGYRVFSYKGSEIIFAGVPFTGPENLDVTFNSAGYDGGGWNLVGNPYMSAIDWDNASGWAKTNLDNAIYIWNSNSGKYASYVNGAGTFGASSAIAIGQSFFVKATALNPTLQINELAKSIDYATFLRTGEAPSIKIILSDTKNVKDEILMRVVDGSTDAFDSEYDAHKLIGEGHNVSVSGADNLPLSISSIPLSSGNYPLEIDVEKTGSYTFSFEGIETFAGTDVYLSDSYLNKMTLIETGTTYSFTLESLKDAARFKLVMTNLTTDYQDAQKTGNMKLYPNPIKDQATVSFPSAISGELILTDATGAVVYTNTLTGTDSFTLSMENYKGVYFLKVITGESIYITKIVKL